VAVWLTYCAFGGQNAEAMRHVAAAIQLYHHHTMVHDDVYDEDVARRHWPTTHVAFADWFASRQGTDDHTPTRLFITDSARRGAVTAIAYGKIMRSLALYGIGTAGFGVSETLAVSNLLNWHDLFDCAGQMKDVDFESQQLPTSETCLNNAWLKTGRLFEVCARAGAIFAGATPQQQDAAALWASNAGVAYQIQDDLEDIVEESEKGVGRGVGVDLLYCKPTYLYALTRELATGTDRETLGRWENGKRSQQGVPAIISIIERSGAKRQVEDKVRVLLDEGRQALIDFRLTDTQVATMDKFARYFVSKDYWQRPLINGTSHVTAIFERNKKPETTVPYPKSHLDSAVHGLVHTAGVTATYSTLVA
jgi:geranylgeranyl diphosphate synthase, type I